MYQVNIGDKILYYPANSDYAIYDTRLNEEVGAAGEFSFKVPSTNPLYSSITTGALITILQDGVEYWRGEVKEVSYDFAKVADVYCLEDLAFLADEYLAPQLITDETYDQRFQAAIAAYNANRSPEYQFTAGYITNVTTSNQCYWAGEYDKSILEELREFIGRDDGYLRVRRETVGGTVTRYIDCVKLSDYGVQATQRIEYGYNLLDYVKDMDYGNLTNALTPYGAELEAEVYEGYSQRLAGTPIQDDASITVYGRHAKNVIFENVTDFDQLTALASAYLTRYSQPQITMEVEAVDLAEIEGVSSMNVGDSVRIISAPFAVDQWLYLTKITRDLQNIDKNTITLSGHVSTGRTITSQTAEAAEAIKNIPSKASILDAAKSNALAILNGAEGGYVTFETNLNDQIEELRIANELDFDQATKCWRWNVGGLAYLSRASASDPWNVITAATMDGGFVADFIKSGSINAIDIFGSTITGSEVKWVNNVGNDNAYMKWANIISETNTLEFFSSSHINMKCASNGLGTFFLTGGLNATQNVSTSKKFMQAGNYVPSAYTSDLAFTVLESGGSKYLAVYKNGSTYGVVKLT